MGKESEWLSTEKICSLTSKKQCPDRIVHNAVGGLAVGLAGGALYRVMAELAANNGVERAASSALYRAPVIAVGCGIVLAVYSTLECVTERVREKRDESNSYIAGAATGALLGNFSWPGQGRGSCYSCSSGPKKTPATLVLNAMIGALAFGFLDGIMRNEFCSGKKKAK